ncbi:MAG TPA: 50S ribosomal protein L24 [Nocardioidaceae bacterium]|nr:50S ribosomal protein L24 [Nocardioidaceae bacterium]
MANKDRKKLKNLSIKKGDVVRVIAGKDKGAEGKVISVVAEQSRVIVEGVNRIKQHTKVVNQGGRAGSTGGIITKEAAIQVSNVMLLVDSPKDNEEKAAKGKVTTRIGFRRDEVTKRRPDGSTYPAQRSVRVARKSGEEI